MKSVLLTSFVFCFSMQCWSQSETGFYLTTPCAKQSQRYTETMGKGRSVCLVTEPIIPLDGISSIGELVVEGGEVIFEVRLNQKSFNKLKLISSSLRKTSLALVIDKKIYVLIGVDEIKSTTSYIFRGETSSYSLIKYYYDLMKDEFDARPKMKSD